jgi:hypothetical protein
VARVLAALLASGWPEGVAPRLHHGAHLVQPDEMGTFVAADFGSLSGSRTVRMPPS